MGLDCLNNKAVRDTRKVESTITRKGCLVAAASALGKPNSSARTVNDELSCKSESSPEIIAQERARNRCTSVRALGPVIHLLSPLTIAVRPSTLIANLQRTNGNLRSMRLIK